MLIIKNFLFRKVLIILITLLFISCSTVRDLTDEEENYSSERQRVMTEKIENRDINLPEGSTILDDNSRFNLGNIFGSLTGNNDSLAYDKNSIVFDVSLDKINFMPLLSVDSQAGLIITDWYSIDGGNQRIKVDIRIMDKELNENSLEVRLFVQSLKEERWIDEGINAEQSAKIKKNILSSARALKVASEL
jgi:uncharacterized protein YceK